MNQSSFLQAASASSSSSFSVGQGMGAVALLCLSSVVACGGSRGETKSAGPVPKHCAAKRQLLDNPGFEGGNLKSWISYAGTGKVVETSNNGSCAATVPSSEHGGPLFSSSSSDGAAHDAVRQVGLRQVFALAEKGLKAGDLVGASASVKFGCTSPDDFVADLFIEFFRGGPNGKSLGQSDTGVTPRVSGEGWQKISTAPIFVPEGADTVVFSYRSAAALGQNSVDVWADDFSLAVCDESASELRMVGPGLAPSSSQPETPALAAAESKLAAKDYDGARAELASALEREPRNWTLWIRLGEALFGLAGTTPKELLTAFVESRTHASGGDGVLFVLGLLAADSRDSTALSWIEQLVAAAPDWPNGKVLLARAYFAAGNDSKVVALLTELYRDGDVARRAQYTLIQGLYAVRKNDHQTAMKNLAEALGQAAFTTESVAYLVERNSLAERHDEVIRIVGVFLDNKSNLSAALVERIWPSYIVSLKRAGQKAKASTELEHFAAIRGKGKPYPFLRAAVEACDFDLSDARLRWGGKDYQLKDGKYSGTDSYSLEVDSVDLVDADGDGDLELKVGITYGWRDYVKQGNRPFDPGTIFYGFGTGCELNHIAEFPNSFEVKDGVLHTWLPYYAPTDPRCCPSGDEFYEFKLVGKQLVKTNKRVVLHKK